MDVNGQVMGLLVPAHNLSSFVAPPPFLLPPPIITAGVTWGVTTYHTLPGSVICATISKLVGRTRVTPPPAVRGRLFYSHHHNEASINSSVFHRSRPMKKKHVFLPLLRQALN